MVVPVVSWPIPYIPSLLFVKEEVEGMVMTILQWVLRWDIQSYIEYEVEHEHKEFEQWSQSQMCW